MSEEQQAASPDGTNSNPPVSPISIPPISSGSGSLPQIVPSSSPASLPQIAPSSSPTPLQQIAPSHSNPLPTIGQNPLPSGNPAPIQTIGTSSPQSGNATMPAPATVHSVVVGSPGTMTNSPPPATSGSSKPPSHTPAEMVKLALSLGTVLMELRGRVMEAQILGPDNVVPPGRTASGFALASNWRGLYSRAISLHQELLGDQEIDLARYNMSADKPAYLNNQVPFVNIGLSSTGLKFGLAEKLRQLLNFLTCLYQKLDTYEKVLEQVFQGSTPYITLPDPAPNETAPTAYNYLIKDLSSQVEALITAWDSYVRERLFAESLTMLAARYGYEAGRLLSNLSWSLVVQTTPYLKTVSKDKYVGKEAELNQLIYDNWVELFKPRRISELQRQVAGLAGILEEDYLANVKKVQPKTSTDPDKLDMEQNQEEDMDSKSPRVAVNCVVQSLDYWQRTVLEMSEHGILQPSDKNVGEGDRPNPPSWNEKLNIHPGWNYDQLMDLRSALVEQWGNWYSLVAGRQDLSSFRVVNIASDLIQDYSQDITRLTSRSLQDAFQELQKELGELTAAGVKATSDVATAGLSAISSIFRNKWLWISVGGAIGLVVLLIAILVLSTNLSWGATVVGLITPLLGGIGVGPGVVKAVSDGKTTITTAEVKGTNDINSKNQQSQQRMSESANVGALVLTAAGAVREYLEKAFTKGFNQLQRELGLISATLAVTGPLIEFVVRNCDPVNEMEFLGRVVWNDAARKSQLNRIVIAAFGPVGAFLIARKEGDKPDEPVSAVTTTSVAA